MLQISTYHLSKDFNLLAQKAVDEEFSAAPSNILSHYYKQCFDQAEIDGVPKTQISVVVRDNLNAIKRAKILKINPDADESECLINHSWYNQVAKECGVSRDYILKSNQLEKPVPAFGNSSSSLNSEFIDNIVGLRESCDAIIYALKNLKSSDGDPKEIKTILTPKQYSNFISEIKTSVKIVRTTFDEKTKIPQNTHHIFKTCLAVEAGLFAACKAYMQQRLTLLNNLSTYITNKQANKFKDNQEPNILAIYKPKNRDEALYQDMYGVQCKCKSWRVKEKIGGENNVECLDCDKVFSAKTLSNCKFCQTPLYDDIIKKIKKNGKCPDCSHAVVLPESF